MRKLSAIIDDLYAAFADVPKPRMIDASDAWRENIATVLLKSSLRTACPDALGHYAFSALNTMGSAVDYLYFLPRILELSAANKEWFPDVELTASKLSTLSFASWPVHRRNAVSQLFVAVIELGLRTGEYECLDPWMCAAGLLGEDMQPLLDHIVDLPEAVLAYFRDNSAALQNHKLGNSYWDPSCSAYAVVLNWFSSEPVRKIVVEAFGCA